MIMLSKGAGLLSKNIKRKIVIIFLYQSVQTCVLGAQKKRLIQIETILLSTHNICFG